MHNLPAETTSFVGRQREIPEVKRLLADARLVTLTGAGGVGKTRIAVRVARALARSYASGSWLVALSDLEHPELVGNAVAHALGLRDHATRSPADAVIDYLRDKDLLLVLDTCERLLDACADFAGRLLRAAPGVRILTTSREPLRVVGEHILVIPPLAVETEATELFQARAAAVRPGFEPTPAVRALCRRLDGLPLAIELAAGRLRSLTVDQITARLDDRFRLLTDRHLPERRHQTLLAAITWSMRLCEPEERLLWARLSVFSGGFDLAAVEAVCVFPADTAFVGDAAERLAGLVDKSIVVGEPGRFRLLDTIREYGLAWLRSIGGEHESRRRHRDYYLGLVREAEQAWTGADQLLWFDRLRQEDANISAALECCLTDPSAVDIGLELAGRLWFFWVACGFLSQGRHYLGRALARDGQPSQERCLALWAAAFVAGTQGDLDAAETMAIRCRADATAIADPRLYAYATESLGMIDTLRGDLDAALSKLDASLAYHRGLDQMDAGELRTCSVLVVTLVMRGDFDEALELAHDYHAIYEASGELWQRSYSDYQIALALRGKGDPLAAVPYLRAAVEVKRRFRDTVGLAMCVEQLAGCAADTGDGDRAARLLGAARQMWQLFGQISFGSPFHSEQHVTAERRARDLIGEAAYEQAFQAGGAFDPDDLVRYALDRRPAAPLTRRELEVATLIAEGLSNRDIAARLVVAKRTADSHVEHILAKLGFTSRAQIAAWRVRSLLR